MASMMHGIALKIERISEGQRFLTRPLAERDLTVYSAYSYSLRVFPKRVSSQ